MSDRLDLLRDDRGVHRLTIRRPEVRNALDGAAWVELADACATVAADTGARALVLTGEGEAFSAGGDFSALRGLLEGDRDHAVGELERVNVALLALAALPVPTVAALNGDAYGGGASLALACDFRVMRSSARLGFVFARVGLSGADTGATWWLTRLVGSARAFEILALGRVFGAAEALAAGLVTEVVADDQLDSALDAFATRLTRLAPLAVAATRRALAGIEGRTLAAQLALEAQVQADVIGSADFREGLAAYRERRPPTFRGV